MQLLAHTFFTQRRNGILFYVQHTNYNLRGKGSLRSNTNTLAGKSVKREGFICYELQVEGLN